MRHHGRVTVWKEDRGFGFVTPDDGGEKVFVHATALAGWLPVSVLLLYLVTSAITFLEHALDKSAARTDRAPRQVAPVGAGDKDSIAQG